MATNDAKNKQEDPKLHSKPHMHLSEALWTVYIIGYQSVSVILYVYIHVFIHLGPVRSNQGQGLMQVRLKVKQAPIKHYIPSDKALAWRYIDQQIITHHMFNTQLYKLFACFWGISMYKKLLQICTTLNFKGNRTPPWCDKYQIFFPQNKRCKILTSISIK